MSSIGGRGQGKRKDTKATSRSHMAGLQFPIGRITPFLKAWKYIEHIGVGVPIYLVVILEYVVAEVLELAIRNDKELSKLLGSVTFANGGTLKEEMPTRIMGHLNTFSDEKAMMDAIEAMNDNELDGGNIIINQTQSKTSSDGGGGYHGIMVVVVECPRETRGDESFINSFKVVSWRNMDNDHSIVE
ncbi:histone H2A.1-like [Cryptomeria japonica]|uniref:histone H2A.1-like n=1 Tax=Cryptomeria japonica TaxID=3369 RepID=UPI0027DA7F56|nr:histone H2A.1-like [Cryptomeria japonica]